MKIGGIKWKLDITDREEGNIIDISPEEREKAVKMYGTYLELTNEQWEKVRDGAKLLKKKNEEVNRHTVNNNTN